MNIYVFGVLAVLWLVSVWFLKKYRVWLFYYIAATVGLAFILVYLNRDIMHNEILLAQTVAFGVHRFAYYMDIPTKLFTEAPGMLMVMVIVQKEGWTLLEIGVESSGVLEMCVLVSLVTFYPGWDLWSRAGRIVVGLGLTWAANTARMSLIMLILHFMGKDMLVLAHTFLGKAFFFISTIAIYWLLITLPSLKLIRQIVGKGRLTSSE